MKNRRSWRRCKQALLAVCFCLGATQVGHAVDFLPVDQVKTGMTGIAKTVLVGDEISTFDVKVLGVMKNRGPSGDLILAKFSGPVMDETGGIAHGMSGSPVYINGKLVGAVAYGWGFADATVGMITPIEDMVKLWHIPYEKNLNASWKGGKDSQLIPLGTPLMAYGFDANALDYLKGKLPNYKFQTYDTAAATGDDVAKPLVPGGSVAALIVDGDLRLGAIGTVTYVDGDQIVAFGHPYLKRGKSNYFMTNANIFTVVKSYESAFKMGSMGKEVGSVVEDRGAGIAGKVGAYEAGIPVRFHLRDLDMGQERNAWVKVIDDQEMTPTLAATALYTFENKLIDRTGEGTAKVTYTITPRDKQYKPLTRTNMFYSSESITEKSVDEFYNVLDVLMNNRFINYEIQDIEVKADLEQGKQTARIVDATASPVIVSPGDTIVVDVTIEPFRGQKEVKEVFFKVPEDQKMGPATLEVRGGGVVPLPYVFEKQKYNLTDEVIRRLKTYKNFEDLYQEIKDTDQNNQIVVEILEDGISMVGDDTASNVKKPKLGSDDSDNLPGDLKKKKRKVAIGDDADVDDKKPQKASIDTQ
ncbi:MAG: SpoIVB peptidase S55, partial [Veillonella sp.]|nr:SpoIVB peptidase S55 [Veillonella sp.]